MLRVQLTCNVQMLQVTQQELQKRLETIQLQGLFSNTPSIVGLSLKHRIVTASSIVETYLITDNFVGNEATGRISKQVF